MDDHGLTLDRMWTFVRVAQLGSLSATARELGIGQSTVSRHINELEEAVGVPLLEPRGASRGWRIAVAGEPANAEALTPEKRFNDASPLLTGRSDDCDQWSVM
jgi:DNA-binding transcriptional ArsR family regulator